VYLFIFGGIKPLLNHFLLPSARLCKPLSQPFFHAIKNVKNVQNCKKKCCIVKGAVAGQRKKSNNNIKIKFHF